jgi:peptidoglycan/xylan/chitin deacetylase (PgdA/CDA1 family)
MLFCRHPESARFAGSIRPILATLAIALVASACSDRTPEQAPIGEPQVEAVATATALPTATSFVLPTNTPTSTALPVPTVTSTEVVTPTQLPRSVLATVAANATTTSARPLAPFGKDSPIKIPGALAGSTVTATEVAIITTTITPATSTTDAALATPREPVTTASRISDTVQVTVTLQPSSTVKPQATSTESATLTATIEASATLDAAPVTLTPEETLVGEPEAESTMDPGEPVAIDAVTVDPTAAAPGTPEPGVRTARVPILMYHYVSVPPADADIYRRDLSVSPDQFAAHLDRIRAEGYTPIRLYDLVANLTQGASLPEKPVIITFDDGYRDNFENAFPLLRERGMPATFFVLTDFIDENRDGYLTWDMAREMFAAGMSIESHGRNHVSLKGKDRDYLIWQALGSLETIEYNVGVRPAFVSYPAGEFDENTIDVFRSANYQAGVTTIQGVTHRSDDLFRLQRVRVRNTTSPDDLARLLNQP